MFVRYIRWRHSRGYGVHSPFAFHIVQEVLSNPYDFYGFHDIDAVLEKERKPRHLRRKTRLLLRLANLMRPGAVFLSPKLPTVYGVALLAAVPHARFLSKNKNAEDADLIVTSDDYATTAFLHSAVSAHGKTIVLINQPRASVQMLLDDFKEGLVLYDRHDILVFPRPDMNRITYPILL